MTRLSHILLPALLAIALGGHAQRSRHAFFNGQVPQLLRHIKPDKPTGTVPGKQPRPLVLNPVQPHHQDLLGQIVRWDCRIRVRLSSNFNLVLTYN